MGKHAAFELWGPEADALAVSCPDPEPVTLELLAEIEARADRPGLLVSWALAQPWPVFCAIVRVIRGETRLELLKGDPMAEQKKVAKTEKVQVRLTPDLLARLDAYLAELREQLPGAELSRGSLIRLLAERGLEAAKGKAKQ